jgi:hypothetical protein
MALHRAGRHEEARAAFDAVLPVERGLPRLPDPRVSVLSAGSLDWYTCQIILREATELIAPGVAAATGG